MFTTHVQGHLIRGALNTECKRRSTKHCAELLTITEALNTNALCILWDTALLRTFPERI